MKERARIRVQVSVRLCNRIVYIPHKKIGVIVNRTNDNQSLMHDKQLLSLLNTTMGCKCERDGACDCETLNRSIR